MSLWQLIRQALRGPGPFRKLCSRLCGRAPGPKSFMAARWALFWSPPAATRLQCRPEKGSRWQPCSPKSPWKSLARLMGSGRSPAVHRRPAPAILTSSRGPSQRLRSWRQATASTLATTVARRRRRSRAPGRCRGAGATAIRGAAASGSRRCMAAGWAAAEPTRGHRPGMRNRPNRHLHRRMAVEMEGRATGEPHSVSRHTMLTPESSGFRHLEAHRLIDSAVSRSRTCAPAGQAQLGLLLSSFYKPDSTVTL